MKMQGIVGLVLIAGGIVLLYFGWTASQSLVDQVSETFTGRFTEETMVYFVGGAVAIALGAGLVLARGR